ncbi:MAG: hypothetical protein RLY31_2907 [Bacteroidota bacterium]
METAKGNFQDAEAYGRKALEMLRYDEPMPELEGYLDSLLYQNQQATGNNAAAMAYLANKQVLFREEQQSNLREVEILYELKENELVISNQALSLNLNRKKIFLLVTVNFILALLFLLPLVLRRIRNLFVSDTYRKEVRMDALRKDLKSREARADKPSLSRTYPSRMTT